VGAIERWKGWARGLKVEAYALYLACRDPRVPWYAKAFAAGLVGYVFSPIDLIPDFIPVLGYLDDLVIVPLGLSLALRMIPGPVLEECRQKARERLGQGRPRSRLAAGVIILIWLLLAAGLSLWVIRLLGDQAS